MDKEDVLTRIVEHINPEIYLFITSRAPKNEVEDLTHQTLAAVCQGLDGFKGTALAEAWDWCYRIARRKVAQFYKKHEDETETELMPPAVLSELLEDSGESTSSEGVAKRIDVLDAMEILRKREPAAYALLNDHFFVGMSYETLSQRYETSAAATRVKVSRALDKLERIMNQLETNVGR